MENPPEIKDSGKSVDPVYILTALLLLNFFLGLFVLMFPSGERNLFGVDLKFVSFHELTHRDTVLYVSPDSVLANVSVVDSNAETRSVHSDSLESLMKKIPEHRRIQYPDNSNKALHAFLESLFNTEQTGTLIRILHFGDSQLEGDRISDYFRNRMQLRFGGYGPGIVLPLDVSRSRISIRQSESRDWEKYAIYGKRKEFPGRYYGIGGSTYRYAGNYQVKTGEDTVINQIFHSDTIIAENKEVTILVDSAVFTWDTVIVPIYETREVQSSWLRYRNATQSYPRVRKISQARLFYGAEEPVEVMVSVDGKDKPMILRDALPFHMVRLSGPVNKELTLTFNGGVSPYIYGIALDGDSGVAVDNFPMRGSSGLGFEKIDRGLLRVMVTKLNARLIIMQYGINVIPNPRTSYAFYERMFKAQLKALKAANPGVSILVIGPSDMSRKRGDQFVSYPNIPLIRDAMKNAAFANGCAFWDLYEAMGGENSMVGWVQSKPALAHLDYTHFSTRGARYVGEMLYEALMLEYERFKHSQLTAKSKGDSP